MAQEVDDRGQRLGAALAASGATVAVAESLTGGELSARMAATPGSGEWFRGGIVAYSSDVKHALLDVPPGPVVSRQAVVAMAEGACRLLGASLGVAVSGVGGPEPQDGEPPGTVWFARHHHGTTDARVEHLPGEPADVVDATCDLALTWLLDAVELPAGRP